MKFHKHPHIRKIRRYRKINTREYALLFSNSNQLLDCICNLCKEEISSSSLYTKDGAYQLIITADQKFNRTLSLLKNSYVIFSDKAHIDDIKYKNQLICKGNALPKMHRAFKVI